MSGLQLYGSEGSVRRNCTSADACHGELSRELQLVKCQSIFGGNKRRYFEVVEFCGQPRSDVLADSMMKLQGATPASTSIQEADVSEMYAIMSVFRLHTHLARCGLSLSQASSLFKSPNSDMQTFSREVVRAYHKQAFDITEKLVCIKAHTFMNSDLNITISPKTVEHYENRMARVLVLDFNLMSASSQLRRFIPGDVMESAEFLREDSNASVLFRF